MDLLILGSSGAEVRELQEKLIKLGFLSSAVSGSFDATTESAVKDFQTQRPWLLTDGVVGPMTLGEIDDTISVLDGQATLKAFAAGSASLDMASLRENALLSLAIQRRLRGLGLYPGGKLIDGDFGPKSQAALKHLCDETDLVTIPFQLTPEIADKLLITQQIPSVLASSQKTSNVSKKLGEIQDDILKTLSEAEKKQGKLGFLDMGAQQSPFKKDIHRGREFLAATKSAGIQSSSPGTLSFSSYPNIGTAPTIDASSLNFLGSDITEACLCLGHFDGGQLTTSWLGKEALDLVECWSASKIIPILNVLCKVGDRVPSNPSDLILKNTGSARRQFELSDVLVDICSYRSDGLGQVSSNALSATLNAFENNRERWIKNQTGNTKAIQFGGKYYDDATIRVPEIQDKSSKSQILGFQEAATGGNLISVYDLTRFISLVGWHRLLSSSQTLPRQTLPSISDRGLNLAITALGTDSARYVDTAISTLGLENVVDSLVVLSKLGFGYSDPKRRNVTELIYTAFAQFIDKQKPTEPKLRSFALTLRTSKPGGGNAVAIQTDTAIATAVTEIIRRIVTDNFVE
jgi:Putative peptidoglycan binding domain